MSIIRTKRKKNNFSIIDNTGLIDPTLSWKETGLLAFLMTKPDDWTISIKSLEKNKVDGRDSVAAALRGLQDKGYVHRIDKRTHGRFETEYLVFETQEDLQEWVLLNGSTVTEKPSRKNRNGSTVTEKPSLLNTDIDITDQVITDLVITEEDSPAPKDKKILKEQSNTVTVAEVVLEDVVQNPPPDNKPQAEISHNQEIQSSISIIPARENSSHSKIADRIRQTWQETGIVPTIPMEYEAWAQEDIGAEVIAWYRRSGRITTTKQGDIHKEFALYVAQQWEGKDIDYGYDRIRKMENDPKSWETLVSLVVKCRASLQLGDRHINIAQKIDRASKAPINLKLNY